jgi:hypothetical protein
MDSSKKQNGRYGAAFLAVLLVGWLLSVPSSASFALAPVPESTFATVNQPVGVAATPGRVLVTQPFCGNPRHVLSIDSTGSASPFATLPNVSPASACVEDYITVAPAVPNGQSVPGWPTPNQAGFPSNFAYVTQGPTIFQIDLKGNVSPSGGFATISSCPASSNGITVDRVGTFGFRLIVVCSNGQVWLLGPVTSSMITTGVSCPSLVCKLLATVPTTSGEVVEGPDVAPLTTPLPALAGQLLVTVAKSQGGGGKIFAVTSSGVVTQVTTTSSPESMAFIPTNKCALGLATAQPTYFTAVFGANTVDFLPLNPMFAGLGGSALIATEQDGITLLSSVNGKISASTFEGFFAEHQGSAFVDCTTPLLLASSRQSGPLNIGPGASGEITVRIFVTPNFNPLTICVGNTTADGSQACPPPLNSPPTYGVDGTQHSFDSCGSSLVATGSGPALQCKFFKAQLGPTSVSNFSGTLIIKVFYLGTTGDGEAGGCN